MNGQSHRKILAKAGQSARLFDLQAIDFALQDTVLYLDAYPENKEALGYYHALLKKRAEILEDLPQDAPLTVYDNLGDEWDWGKNPWPWEPGANRKE